MGASPHLLAISPSTARGIVIAIRTISSLAVILVFIAAVLMAAYMVFWWVRNTFGKPALVPAKVVRKHERCGGVVDDDPFLGDQSLNPWSFRDLLQPIAERTNIAWLDKYVWPSDFYVVFRTARGSELEFAVPGEFYISVTEGDEGFLEYRGETFHRFASNQLRWRS